MITPYKDNESSKKQQVALMFDNIAHKYDFLNHLLSMGIDKIWRNVAVKMLVHDSPKQILDIATGTGDFAIQLAKLNPEKITGIDISKGMIAIAKEKILKSKYTGLIEFEEGDSENLRFVDNTFDAITAGFGVRNFENLEKGLQEMYRVLKPGGSVAILEFSQPERFPVKQLYNFYFTNILPKVGAMFSKDKFAYTYLPDSVYAFPSGQSFVEILKKCNFKSTKHVPLTLGIASIYYAKK